MSDMFDLSGKTALVTGGGTGLGYHMTRALAQSGANVMITSRREEVLRASAERLNADSTTHGKVSYFPVDLADRQSVTRLADHAIKTMDGVDIFIGNACLEHFEHIEKIKNESIDSMLQANIASNVELVRAFTPGMRKKKWGRFLFSSSIMTITTSPHEGCAMYTAVKGALNNITKTIAAELGHDNITANAIMLGLFYTDMVRDCIEFIRGNDGDEGAQKFKETFCGTTALGRAGRLEEIEGLIKLLASNAGSYITGSNLVIDGGLSIMLRSNGIVE
jgi:NAD(P)-dependent dehydrogenase (short-subunit alcohol dehydrogenase family)